MNVLFKKRTNSAVSKALLAGLLADGVEATVALGAAAPEIAVVMLTLRDDDGTRSRVLAAGAAGFVGKHRPEGELVEGIRRAAAPDPGTRRSGGRDERPGTSGTDYLHTTAASGISIERDGEPQGHRPRLRRTTTTT